MVSFEWVRTCWENYTTTPLVAELPQPSFDFGLLSIGLPYSQTWYTFTRAQTSSGLDFGSGYGADTFPPLYMIKRIYSIIDSVPTLSVKCGLMWFRWNGMGCSLQFPTASRSARFPVPNVRHRLPTTSHLRTHEAQHTGGLWHNAIGAAKPWLNNLWRRRRSFHQSCWIFPGGGRLRIGKRQSEQTCRWPTRVLPSFSQKFGANSTIILARALWKFEVAKTQSPKQVDWFLWLKLNTFSNTFLARSAAVDLSVAWDAQETKVCGIIM